LDSLQRLRRINFSPSKNYDDQSILLTSQDQIDRSMRSKRGIGPK